MLKKSVEGILANSAHVRRTPISVLVSQENVTIRGKVQTFFQKQMIQEEVRYEVLENGRRILNETEVS